MNLPTQLTVLRILLTPVFLYTLFLEHIIFKFLSFLIFVIASLTDLYDGYYAKKYGYVTKWGKFLDPLADKILVSSALIAFNILGYIQLWVVIVIIARDFLITGLRSYALYKEHPITTREWARWKTFLQMSSVFVVFLFILLNDIATHQHQEFYIIKTLENIGFINKLMTFVALVTAITGILYLIENRKQIKSLIISCYKVFLPSD